MVRGLYLKLLMGAISAEPVPAALMESLASVQVTETVGGQSGFQLVFAAGKGSPILQELLPNGYFDAPRRVIVLAVMNGSSQILSDGVITRQELSASNEPGKTTLTVTGLDLSQVMDLIDFSGIPWPAMPAEAQVTVMLAKYSMYGIMPRVIPSPFLVVPNPLKRIPHQHGTDLAYLKRLASEVGYVFYVEPGPGVGMSTAYWGPEVKIGWPQPALTVNMDAHSNVDSLTLSFDGIQKTLFTFFYQEEHSKIPIPIPVPDLGILNPPLGRKIPLPLSVTKLDMVEPRGQDDSTAKYDPVLAAAQGLARASQRAEVVSGSGSLDVSRYGSILRPRGLVSVRGAGHVYDGQYYVKSVTHTLKQGTYKQSFRLSRNALVSLTSEVPV